VPAALRCEIFPADLDVAVEFYVTVLGFELTKDERDHASAPYVALARDGVRLGALRRPGGVGTEARRPPVGVELVLEVDDLDRERERVLSAGWPLAADLAEQPWGLRDFRLLDPDGYYWRITNRRGA
jgi:lactoylglutathione lyase